MEAPLGWGLVGLSQMRLFGSFQIAGSFGFLTGPLVGGVLVEVLRGSDGTPEWAAIFAVLLTWQTMRMADDLRLPNATMAGLCLIFQPL